MYLKHPLAMLLRLVEYVLYSYAMSKSPHVTDRDIKT